MGGPRPYAAFCLPVLFLMSPAAAQKPDGTDARPEATPPPVTAPAAPASTLPPPASVPPPPASAPLPNVVIDGALSGPLRRPHVEPLHAVYGGEVTFDANSGDGDVQGGLYTLTGHVRLHEADTTLKAAEVTFNGKKRLGIASDALLTQGLYTLRGDTIQGTPELITADGVDLTTVPPDQRPDYHVRAQTLTLDEKTKRGVLRNATLYLFGARLLTVPRVTFHAGAAGGEARRRVTLPIIGVSARYGTYAAFGSGLRLGPVPLQYRALLPMRQKIELSLISQQALYVPHPPAAPPASVSARPLTLLERIRAFATVPRGLLPAGDPLLFHDFLPEPNPITLFDVPARGGLGLSEEVSTHVAARGRLRDDLYVSRLPEVSLNGQIPLTRVVTPPVMGDPQAFRESLRHLAFYADAQETVGAYREQPTNVFARRLRTQVGLSARPLLIAPNTVLLPRLSVATSSYSGSKAAYHYDQASVAVNHYFSSLTAVGVQFLASKTGGDSPFNFDVLDTSRELDVRLQIGGSRLVTAGRVRYDLSRRGVIDYQVALSPLLSGLAPVFSYNFRTRSLGLGLEIRGITF